METLKIKINTVYQDFKNIKIYYIEFFKLYYLIAKKTCELEAAFSFKKCNFLVTQGIPSFATLKFPDFSDQFE